MSEAAPLQFVPRLPEPEAARANFYALLARLFYAPPDAGLRCAGPSRQAARGAPYTLRSPSVRIAPSWSDPIWCRNEEG